MDRAEAPSPLPDRRGANDMWIAATALAHAQPLLTRNAREFARVPGLQVESY